VKNTDTAQSKGYDAGKKISGIKRHLLVDTQGFIQSIAITPANVTDRAGALQAIARGLDSLSNCQTLMVDGGYTGAAFAEQVKQHLPTATVQVVKRSALHQFVVLPQRWIVERTFAWLEKCRRLWKNCERKLNTSLQFVILAHLSMLLRRS
jgi:transposase